MEFLPLKARIAIHVGDVLVWENSSDDIARGAKPVEVEGLAKPVAARLMHLALPGQILMTGVAQALVARSQIRTGWRARAGLERTRPLSPERRA